MKPLRMRRFAAVMLAGAVAAVASGCASTLTDAATVTLRDRTGPHTFHVDRAQFQSDLSDLVGNPKFQQWAREQQVTPRGDNTNTTDQLFAGFLLRQMINQVPYEREFQNLGLKVTPELRDTAKKQLLQEFALQSETRTEQGTDANGQPGPVTKFVGPGAVFNSFPKAFQDRLIDREARAFAVIQYYRQQQPTPAMIRRFYQEFAAQLCPSQRVIAHIALRDEASARSVLDQINSGKTTFRDAAKKSLDTATAPNGGLAGCLSPGTFVKEVEDAAGKAPFNKPVGPIKTPRGYEIVMVVPPSLESLGDQVAQVMSQGGAISLRMDQMKVRLDPRYGTIQRAQQGFTVQPPAVPTPRDQRERDRSTDTSTTTPAGGGG